MNTRFSDDLSSDDLHELTSGLARTIVDACKAQKDVDYALIMTLTIAVRGLSQRGISRPVIEATVRTVMDTRIMDAGTLPIDEIVKELAL
jgi:hypothetical protein